MLYKVNDQNTVTNPISGIQRFFRLSQPMQTAVQRKTLGIQHRRDSRTSLLVFAARLIWHSRIHDLPHIGATLRPHPPCRNYPRATSKSVGEAYRGQSLLTGSSNSLGRSVFRSHILAPI
jgi:hypothetical protein